MVEFVDNSVKKPFMVRVRSLHLWALDHLCLGFLDELHGFDSSWTFCHCCLKWVEFYIFWRDPHNVYFKFVPTTDINAT